MNDTSGTSKSYADSGYQFLSREKVMKLESSGCREEEIKMHNEIARHEINTFLENNTLLKCTKINDTFPITFVMGFEKEGKSSVINLLQPNLSRPGADDVSSLKMEELHFSLSSQSDENKKARLNKQLSESNAKVVLIVLSCAIHRGEDYLSPVMKNLTNFQIGKKENQRKCLVVLTHAKSGLKGQSLDKHFDNQLQEGGSIADLYKMAYPHIIAVEATEGSPYGMKRQREQVLSHLSRVLNTFQETSVDKTLYNRFSDFYSSMKSGFSKSGTQ